MVNISDWMRHFMMVCFEEITEFLGTEKACSAAHGAVFCRCC